MLTDTWSSCNNTDFSAGWCGGGLVNDGVDDDDDLWRFLWQCVTLVA